MQLNEQLNQFWARYASEGQSLSITTDLLGGGVYKATITTFQITVTAHSDRIENVSEYNNCENQAISRALDLILTFPT